jgi:hypothetical protein
MHDEGAGEVRVPGFVAEYWARRQLEQREFDLT